MSTATTEVKNSLRDVKTDAENAAHRAGTSVRNMLDSASDELTHVKEVVNDQIHNKPVQSSLIALGAGVILGLLIRR